MCLDLNNYKLFVNYIFKYFFISIVGTIVSE